MRPSRNYVNLLILLCFYNFSAALAATETPQWQPCVDMQDKASAEVELNCYREAAQKIPEVEKQRPLLSTRARGLTQEWAPSNDPLNVYKQNYVLLYANASRPNHLPTSPNPQNQVTTGTLLDDRDMKFQLSMKHDLADFGRFGSLWFGYTQLSFWQFYDSTNSRPFRENNYEPELIYSIRPNELIHDLPINPSILNFGLVHQSNGQPNPRSRSWNRLYVQAGIERRYENDRRLEALVRVWKRIPEDSVGDDNPDITDFLGRGDIELRYSHSSRLEATLTLKSRAYQLDVSVPWDAWRLLTLAVPVEHNTNIHLQYFNGYGESLIDYNQQHETWGVGLSFPFD